MSQNFQAGDYLIFQIESGYGLLRILAIDETADDTIWHLAAFNELFLDPESADVALSTPENLTINLEHVALTTRAFEATQTARMINRPLTADELMSVDFWRAAENREVSDRSIRLMLGWR